MNDKFIKIYENYQTDIFRLIFSYTLNIADTKDILQETFIKYYKNINKINYDDIGIKKWLVKVALNNVKNYKKNNWKSKTLLFDEKNSPSISQNSSLEMFETLNKLNKKYLIPIYLYYYEGYSIEEIAKLLKISKSAIKMRLSRAKEILKKEMEMV